MARERAPAPVAQRVLEVVRGVVGGRQGVGVGGRGSKGGKRGKRGKSQEGVVVYERVGRLPGGLGREGGEGTGTGGKERGGGGKRERGEEEEEGGEGGGGEEEDQGLLLKTLVALAQHPSQGVRSAALSFRSLLGRNPGRTFVEVGEREDVGGKGGHARDSIKDAYGLLLQRELSAKPRFPSGISGFQDEVFDNAMEQLWVSTDTQP